MRKLLLTLGAAVAALPLLTAGAALPANDAVSKASAYIHSTLAPDGSYGSESVGQNMDAVLAVRASGYDPAKDRLPGGQSPADYLVAHASELTSASGAGKAALAAEALGLDPASVGGTDLTAAITGALDAATGRYAADDFSQSLAMLGLACTGRQVDAKAVTALRDAQLESGGWGFNGAADPDTTAIAVQALVASGVSATDPDVAKALGYINASQANDGGWGFDPAASNTSSTAFVVQALIALGENPEGAAYSKGANTPVSFLLSQQLPDGSFEGFDPLFAANQVTPALAGRTFCNMSETAVTHERVTVTPTPITTVPVPPTTTATASASVAPSAPATGSGTGGGGGSPAALVGILTGAILATTGGTFLALRRR